MDERSVESIDDYIAQFESAVQVKLRSLRTLIHEAAPAVTERISYRMPAFFLHGSIAYFAAFKRHLGLYPGASALRVFAGELTAYARGKGSIRFPYDEPLPLGLIRRIVEFRVAENRVREAVRMAKS
jgi:uncharacterized protein YdhG (YjbR/CyaY superfamily)